MRAFNAKVKSVHNRNLDGIGDVPSGIDITVGISDATVCVHLRNVQHLNLGCAGKVLNPGNLQRRSHSSLRIDTGVGTTYQINRDTGDTLIISMQLIVSIGNIYLEMLLVDLQAHLGIDLKLASERSTIIGGALQRGFTDAVARLQGVTGLADRTVRVGAAGQQSRRLHPHHQDWFPPE